MLDVFNIPRPETNNWVFLPASSGATATSDWQIWQKPKNIKFVSFFVIGSGGGGGGGQITAGTIRSGGGGGGSSAASRGVFQSSLIPDVLYIRVPKGGIGGSSNSNGNPGGLSYVSVEPTINTTDVILASGAAAAGGGTAAGGAGIAGTVFLQTAGFYSYWGIINTNIGLAGGAGGSATGGGSISPINAIVNGGAGGAGSSAANANFGGGQISNLNDNTPIIIGGGAGGGDGNPGAYTMIPSINSSGIKLPMFFTGGSGGGSNGAAGLTGGAGGAGSFGSGGGGGGAGGATGGAGGNGGDGIVIITAW